MRRVLSLLAVVAIASIAMLAACKEPTRIVVEAYTNVEFKEGIVTAFTIGSPGQTEKADPTTETGAPWDGSFVGSLVVVPSTAEDAALSVKIVMGVSRGARECVAPDYGGCIVARRRLRYVPNERLRLPITLYAQCEDVPCDELSTCNILAQCVPLEPECKDGTCALPGEIGEDGNVVVPPADAAVDGVATPKDASDDASSDAPSDAPGDSGGDTSSDSGSDGGGRRARSIAGRPPAAAPARAATTPPRARACARRWVRNARSAAPSSRSPATTTAIAPAQPPSAATTRA